MRTLWTVLLALYLLPAQAEVLKFAFAANEPPISTQAGGIASGLIPELAELVAGLTPELHYQGIVLPWARAQYSVETGKLDALLTYPSDSRQAYALFTATPAYHLDFGYLIFHKDHPRRAQLEAAKSFADLASFIFVAQQGAEFEEQNVPASITRLYANQLDGVMHLLLKRRDGDFAIMQPEQAVYLAKGFGYAHDLAMQPVDFIPDAKIPFHVGIRRSHPQAAVLIERIEQTLHSHAFQREREALIQRYR